MTHSSSYAFAGCTDEVSCHSLPPDPSPHEIMKGPGRQICTFVPDFWVRIAFCGKHLLSGLLPAMLERCSSAQLAS